MKIRKATKLKEEVISLAERSSHFIREISCHFRPETVVDLDNFTKICQDLQKKMAGSSVAERKGAILPVSMV